MTAFSTIEEHAAVSHDPTVTNPDLYRVVMENDRVRVLEYRDTPGASTTPHGHPDSVMVTLSSFRRRLISPGHEAEVEMPSGAVRWLGEQEHVGQNIGLTETHAIFVELKEPSATATSETPIRLGPSQP